MLLRFISFFLIGLIIFPSLSEAADIPTLSLSLGNSGDPDDWFTGLKIVMGMTVLTLAPSILVMMTSFTRILVVFGFLRQAMGTQQAPPNQILVGLALFMTVFVMMPVWQKIDTQALTPYLNEEISQAEAFEKAKSPLRTFMLAQTRDSDLNLFASLSGNEHIENYDEVPLSMLLPAFVTSELKTAFQIGFMIFIPFLIIDLVVASVLMAMGMMMLSPLIISLPFKLMLFVLVDGWALIMGTLASSFYM